MKKKSRETVGGIDTYIIETYLIEAFAPLNE